MKLKTEYLSGLLLEKQAIRKYKNTIIKGEKKGGVFYTEIVTKLKGYHHWGKGEVFYFTEDGDMCDSMKSCINDIKIT